MLNYGYNKFMMTNNDYYIIGTNPSGGNREFYVLQNYWGGTPDSNKFNVYNADVIYIPFYSSGVYFCILETENFNETKRMILLK